MATTFKTLLNSDIANTRTLLHEAIPITGTIISGTYQDENIKTFSHGMYEAVFDYPFLSSSANHIFDITAGYSPHSEHSSSANMQNSKKINIYNQHAQVLTGYSISGTIREFDTDGNYAAGGSKMREVFFINFSRLLTKDEIKKESFRLMLFNTASAVRDPAGGSAHDHQRRTNIGDYGASTTYKVNSPAGEYALLYGSPESASSGDAIGHIYYQAGIAVITASIFSGAFGDPSFATVDSDQVPGMKGGTFPVDVMLTASTITNLANGLRFTFDNIDFNNTTELNSSIYFCRANTQDYNYSANTTYLSSSKILVKGDNPKEQPVSYITTVGLYSATNELLAVAKLSEPLKKSPSNEITLRVRLDY